MVGLPATSAKPDIVAIDDLLDSVNRGEVRIPQFQRPYIWSPEDMIQLLDSVLKGYPIGSLLLWQTEQSDITSASMVGPLAVPKDGPAVRSYVLDGHQRLATLFGVLRLPEDYPRTNLEHWRWWIAYDLERQELTHLTDRVKAVPLHFLPLRNVLRTVDFARRTREMLVSAKYSEVDSAVLLDRADVLQRSIRDYRVPLTVMRHGSLDDAVTIFARVNQRGRDMTADQMVSALTYRDKSEGGFDLASIIDEILGELRAYGFGDLERRTILQTILAVAGLDFSRTSYERIADRSSHSKLRPAAQQAKFALKYSAEFLRDKIGITTSRLLPYSSLVVLLSLYFATLQQDAIATTFASENALKRWFWATSFNGWFAGANSTDIRKAAETMRQFAKNPEGTFPNFEEFFLTKALRPFPETFDRRSARIRSLLLVQIIAGQPLDPQTSEPINGFDIFANSATRDIPYFFLNQRRPMISSPANRVILPGSYPRVARSTFRDLLAKPAENMQQILRAHCISDEAASALMEDNFDRFISAREKTLMELEEQFLKGFGLKFNQSEVRSVEEFDADNTDESA